MEPTTSTPMRTFVRIVAIAAIIALLVILSIGIVKIVPRVVSSLATATVSITSLFSDNATTTKPAPSGGFVVATPNTMSSSSNSNYPSRPASNVYTASTSTSGSISSNYMPRYNQNPSTNYVNGIPDLAVNIISKGVINPSNGAYIVTNNFSSTDTVVIKFKIENRGTAPTGKFGLTVQMPASTVSDRLKQVTNVGSIPAGGAIEAQAVFSNPQVGSNLPVTITADPSGLIRDSDRSNNIQSISLYVTQGAGSIYTGGSNTVYGQPDFIVQILAVGTLDQFNQFIPTANIAPNGRVAVQFRIINQGNNANVSNGWYFRSEMTDYPNPNRIYDSSIQSGLVGGQSTTYTLGFDNLQRGTNSITLYVDSQNNIYETSENNNIGSVNFSVY